MTQQDRVTNPELLEDSGKESCLGRRCPDARARAFTVTETRPVETQHAGAAGKKFDEPADHEDLDHGSVAVKQHHASRGGITTIEIMEPDSLTDDEGTDRRVPSFGQ